MDSRERVLEFIADGLYVKLKWNVVLVSEEMVVDAVDSLGKTFLNYFQSSFVNFLV
jgi:hypothetical protein